jgi:ribosomal protein L37AE/L43A
MTAVEKATGRRRGYKCDLCGTTDLDNSRHEFGYFMCEDCWQECKTHIDEMRDNPDA